jgi:hypothetical protein
MAKIMALWRSSCLTYRDECRMKKLMKVISIQWRWRNESNRMTGASIISVYIQQWLSIND